LTFPAPDKIRTLAERMPSAATRTTIGTRELSGAAAARIIVDAVAFRLQSLEMANLAGAVSIALALRLPWTEVAFRALFAFVLNALVYLNNDWFDAEDDLRAPGRDGPRTRFLAQHMDSALAAQGVLLVILIAAALAFDPGLLLALLIGGGICVWYSHSLKRVPYLDVVAMAVWGIGMPMCGFPLDRTLGWCLALQLGTFAAVYETIQVMRDAPADAIAGIRTSGVVLGVARTRVLSRALMVVASLVAGTLLHPVAGVVAAAALLIPLDGSDVARRWTQVRMIYAAAWLIAIAWIWLTGSSAGLLWSIAAGGAAR
jgi:4-hydroxybenzoate polyprenyltransferase